VRELCWSASAVRSVLRRGCPILAHLLVFSPVKGSPPSPRYYAPFSYRVVAIPAALLAAFLGLAAVAAFAARQSPPPAPCKAAPEALVAIG
jgi:hypothetical protein